MLSGMALDMEDTVNSRGQLLAVLGKKAVTCLTDMKIEEITDDGVIASDKGGVKRAIGADNVVLALGFKPRTGLYNALKGRVPEVYAVGDCVESRRLGDAIHEGFFRAKNI